MSSLPESSSIALAVLESKQAANNNVPVPGRAPPPLPLPEVKIPVVPVQKTFLMQARKDLKKCEGFDSSAWFSSKNRTRMLTLFRAALTKAEATGVDSQLYTVYVSIDQLIKGWPWEDGIKNVFNRTLEGLHNNQYRRQRGRIDGLLEKINTLEGSIEEQKKIMADQNGKIDKLTDQLETVSVQSKTTLKKLDAAAETARISQETVDKLLARLNGPNASSGNQEEPKENKSGPQQ